MKHSVILGFALLWLYPLTGMAQQVPAETLPAAHYAAVEQAPRVPLPAEVARHVIRQRDLLHIVCWTARGEVVNAAVPVGTDGLAVVPHLGAMKAAGRTVRDLHAEVSRMYENIFPGSSAYISVEQVEQRLAALPKLPDFLTRPIAVGDRLRIRCATGDRLHMDVTVAVAEDLTVALPPLGVLPVRNLTLPDLRDILLARYRAYYPDCSVDLTSSTVAAPEPADPSLFRPDEALPWDGFPGEVSAAEVLERLPWFGSAIFAHAVQDGSFTAPATTLPVSPDYLAGPGDILSIRVWTDTVEHYHEDMAVSLEGRIYLPLLGELGVAGQTLAQIESRLQQQFRTFYRDCRVRVMLSQVRTVEVYVTGDAAAPGKYTLGGTATVFTALYAAGGPGSTGSLRNIRLVRRGEEPRMIDLYDYLLTGNRDADELLQSGDTLFIGRVGDAVGIAGLVGRPALYEVESGISIADALEMAAGIKARGYAPNVEVWRVDRNMAWHVINVDLSSADSGRGSQFPLQNGDLVMVRSVLERPRNTVEVSGAVRRPGIYEVGEGTDLGAILRRAEGVEDTAYMAQGVLWRLAPDNEYSIIRFSLREVLDGGAAARMALVPGDRVQIHSRYEVTQTSEVTVEGAVAAPGVFPWGQGMQVSDLLLLSRGPLPGAHIGRADLYRLQPDRQYSVIAVRLDRIASGDPDADIDVQPGDRLSVLRQDEVAPRAEVSIYGFVQKPGVVNRVQGMRISDLIYAAGGLLPEAGDSIEYARGRVRDKPEVRQIALQVAPDGEFTVEPDIVLQDDDQVNILGSGDMVVRPRWVRIEGHVARPGVYTLLSDTSRQETIYELIERAGGLLLSANPAGMILYRSQAEMFREGQSDDVTQVLHSLNREMTGADTTLTHEQKATALSAQIGQQVASLFGGAEGDVTVVIPPRSLSVTQWAKALPIEGEQLISSAGAEGDLALAHADVLVVPQRVNTVAVLGAVVRPGMAEYVEGQALREYINRSGGLAPDAVLSRVVVIRANGSALPANQVTAIAPGDVLIVPSDYMIRRVAGTSSAKRALRTLLSLAAAVLIF